MRQIVLDTETTGLEPKLGHRIIEVACVEMVGRRLTNRHFHRYMNPDREVDEGALAVHGITTEFLQDKPRFSDIASEFLEFVSGAELVIHNAAFDMGFLNHELALMKLPPLDTVCAGVKDTLRMARELHPGKRNNLDALCERYQVSNAHRTLHGALLDAELLAEVYLAMTRGQESLIIDLAPGGPRLDTPGMAPRERPPLCVLSATDDELAHHERVLAGIDKESKGQCLWLQKPPAPAGDSTG